MKVNFVRRQSVNFSFGNGDAVKIEAISPTEEEKLANPFTVSPPLGTGNAFKNGRKAIGALSLAAIDGTSTVATCGRRKRKPS